MPSHFEDAVEKAMDACGKESLLVELGNSHQHALVKGKAAGLKLALEIYKKTLREDDNL
jgi:hypothetical protein